jgi:hypothetical protein
MVKERFATAPLFWGRYFKRPGFAQDYQPQLENRVFNDHHIRLLPIARQTNRVAGTASDGAGDAILNVDACIGSLGVEHLAKIGGELLMFLDVEGTSDSNPNLSLDYWIGWSSALVAHSRRVVFHHAQKCMHESIPEWDAPFKTPAVALPLPDHAAAIR